MSERTVLGTSINPTPTITLEAGADLTKMRYRALAVNGGKLVAPTAGANVIGIAIGETDETVKAGEDVDVQIKDIGKWEAGETIAIGDELATDASGKAVKAKTGNFIVGVAVSAASAAGTLVKVQVAKMGYKA